MSDPIAVCISDIHFSIKNLELAAKALKAAIKKAENLKIPLIISGDLNDTKAIIRAEVANVLCETIKHSNAPIYIVVGNHDLCNEKGTEHSLNFLRPYAKIIDAFTEIRPGLTLIPYQSEKSILEQRIRDVSPYTTVLIMHQGFTEADMGDYVLDKSAISTNLVKDFTVISGHYHKHQTIGTVTYIGSPYTMSFGEANDGPKGFLILNSDGTYTREILDYRRHVKLTLDVSELSTYNFDSIRTDDLLWLIVTGPRSQLEQIVKHKLMNRTDFKLDLVPTDREQLTVKAESLTDSDLFDSVIDTTAEPDDTKTRLKQLWRELL